MVRSFERRPVAPDLVDSLLRQALRAPSAGNADSLEVLVLDTPQQTDRYWETTLTDDRRSAFPWPHLLDAPVLLVVWVDPSAYVRRYAESDKVSSGLGSRIADWPVPYWYVDGGAAVMSILHGAVDVGLGALLFGLFEHEDAIRGEFGVPQQVRAVGTVAVGHPLPVRRSKSAQRPKRPFDDAIHRGQW